jgi:integrase
MAPKIKLFRIIDARMPHSLSVEEEQFLFHQLPSHLLRMALYTANTGSRQEEICGLKWEWERKMPERDISVFVIPGEKVKNTEERLVVLNRIARSVIEEARENARRMLGSARMELRHPRDLGASAFTISNTFGRRLRAAGVSFEDRQDLLGHKSRRTTTHYSHAELGNLIAAAERACG